MERKEDAKEGDLALRVVVDEVPPQGASEPDGTDLVLDQLVELLLSVGLVAEDAAEPGAMRQPDDPSPSAGGPGQAVPKHAAGTPGATEPEKALVVASGWGEAAFHAGEPLGASEPEKTLVVGPAIGNADGEAEEGHLDSA